MRLAGRRAIDDARTPFGGSLMSLATDAIRETLKSLRARIAADLPGVLGLRATELVDEVIEAFEAHVAEFHEVLGENLDYRARLERVEDDTGAQLIDTDISECEVEGEHARRS